ncbi:MAG: tRNA (uridine(34)/cytosine(34)/5-carboxymethylaminomethyluridine(34)-2'-O)-methyltransferase TrmL [Gammaproteobacteria bacterium]|nr:tRNA (uridine(34)/cytosine(34)/5-carboxymethylaminomethyluridine(34)-2'-O)-methyltransferase TrmL [Gammaproteobacteria bacterium]
MFHLILYQPEIPPNTGNIIRLCANTGTRLHLIRPLGFSLEDRYLRRAGLDYHEMANVTEHDSLSDCLAVLGGRRLFALSTRGSVPMHSIAFEPGDVFLFGAETSGLPSEVLESVPVERRLRIPMVSGNRSLNLSNAAAVVIYEAWRQAGFE